MREQFRGEIWQPGFHEHRIRDGEDFENQRVYIAANPEHGACELPIRSHELLDKIDPVPGGIAWHRVCA